MMFDNKTINDVWEKGVIDPKYPADKVRKDACGAWIIKSHYGKHDSPFGWDVDHIYPRALYSFLDGGDDIINHIDNLRPLHHKNNKAKGTNYPTYQAAVKADGDRNVDCIGTFEVNSQVQNRLKTLLHV